MLKFSFHKNIPTKRQDMSYFSIRMQKFDVGLEKIKIKSISFRKWSHMSLNVLW